MTALINPRLHCSKAEYKTPLVQGESRSQTRLVSAEAQPNDGRSQTQGLSGASRLNPYR